MAADFVAIAKETVAGIWEIAWLMFLIIIPLMLLLEVLRGFGLLDRLHKYFKPLLRYLHLSPEAGIPLLAGNLIGLSYSAGILIHEGGEKRISPREMWIISLFLCLCHSLLEDTLLFVAVGADARYLLGVRVPLALLVTHLAGRLLSEKRWQDLVRK